MLTQEQILVAVKSGRDSGSIDGRDYGRLIAFFPATEFPTFGFELKEGGEHTPKEWTRENVLAQLADDIDFGFEKALNRRGLSAGAMNSVALMWMWVLEDDLQHDEEYAQYGLPLLKKIAVKYDLPNQIGDDYGDEYKYSSEADYE